MDYSFLQKFLFICCLIPTMLLGQATSDQYLDQDIPAIDIKEEDWAKVTNGITLEAQWDEQEEQSSRKGTELTEEPAEEEKKGFNFPSFSGGSAFFSALLKILLVIGVVAIVLVLLKNLAGANGFIRPSNRAFNPDAPIDTQAIAENIHDYDLKALIEQAIGRKDYTIATRLYYLLAIQSASENGLIKWKKDKTNRNYLNEIQSMGLKEQFRQLTYIFERAWYGETVIEVSDFGTIQQQFQQFIQLVTGTK